MEKNIKTKVISEIKNAVLRYQMVNKGDHIVFGLSGGPDSVCLFFAFTMLREELGITMSAVHINHKFRPGAAEEDQSYVEDLCEKLGIRCRSEVHDCAVIAEKLGITSEEAGRKVRYEAFDREAAYAQEMLNLKKEQVKIAIAHNMEDQAETLLFRIMRGTGTDGLAGIERTRKSENGYTIIRPILGLERRDIEAFCEELDLGPHIDLSNLEPVYTRNKIRLGLIPYIKENFNENITEALNRLAVIAGEDKDYLWRQAEECYAEARGHVCGAEEAAGEIALSMGVLRKAHSAVRHRVMLKALSDLGLTQDIGAVHMEAADGLIERGATGKTAEFPYGYKAVTRYENIVFKRPEAAGGESGGEKSTGSTTGGAKSGSIAESLAEQNAENVRRGEMPVLSVRTITLAEWRKYEKRKAAENDPKNFAAFDLSALRAAKGAGGAAAAEKGDQTDAEKLVTLRHKEAGDFIAISAGRKKLQDLFTDSKVPRDLRDGVLLAAAGSEILWVIGADSGISGLLPARSRFTANYRISGGTEEVLLLEINI